MKTIDELKAFYETDLVADLQVLEIKRLEILKKIRKLRLIMIPLLFIPVGFLPCVFFDTDEGQIIVPTILQIVYMIVICGIWSMRRRKIIHTNIPPEFKTKIIERIVKFIDPELIYEPKKYITIDDFFKGKIFYFSPGKTEYYGDDLVRGSIGKTHFAFSEIRTYYIERVETKDGVDETVHHIFHGLFFYANFNKKFNGMTFVFPRKRKKKYGRMRGKNILSRMQNDYGETIKLEDPRFDKHFVVYGNDQVEARYILSTGLMKRISDYREKTGKYIFISFVDDRVHVAIAYTYSLFEFYIDTSLLDFSVVREYYEDMTYAIGIVEDLNLNTRIWT
ncbi:MAG TPA: DUF3137 domain-containing protein [Smithellaceae bacterium]|nr:DUF3137 domain-containing protein [Smithellaceae bacterium]